MQLRTMLLNKMCQYFLLKEYRKLSRVSPQDNLLPSQSPVAIRLVSTKYQEKLKESMVIKWEKPDLNQQVKHINLTLSL